VAICGYGPVGSLCSLLMAAYGYTVLLIDKNIGTSPTARAINTDGEQLRIFDKFGLAEKIVENSNQIEKIHFSKKSLEPIQSITQTLGDSSMGWPNQVLFYQPELEGFVREVVESKENIDVMELCELTDFNDKGNEVEIICKNENQEIKFLSKFLIGCDGASSFVRKKLNIDLDDFGYNQKWLVCDAHLTQNIYLKNELIQVCDPKRPCTFLHGRRGHLRFEFRVMPEDNLKELKDEAFIWNLLSPWINKKNAILERADIYNFHACIANRWNINNVLIAGDSAHQMPPFMGAGMGTGIRDVTNLSWKIHLILQKKANKKILETYQKERYPHAKWTIGQTITIGELIEGFCAAEQGKEFIPEKKGYDVRFPHIPSGIFKNSKDGVTGYPIPQPKLFINNNYIKLDKLINSNFVIMSKSDLKKVSKKANQIIEKLEIKFIRIKDIDDPDKLLEKLFDLYKYVLVRPDLYVYGGSNENDLSEMIESIAKSFELI
jgi:3-(3-hydroxy-phenyl)propionate hydroxylase